MKELVEKLKNRMGELQPHVTEEDIKVHIVFDILLKGLGYENKKLHFENSIYDERSDITYFEDGEPIIVIETKGFNKRNKDSSTLKNEDKKQLIDYLTTHEKRTVWGILTNGVEYYLFNNNIQGTIQDKIVFHFFLNDKKAHMYFRYLSYESIFKNKTTNPYVDIARYEMYWNRAGNKSSSFVGHKSTLNKFFGFYLPNRKFSSLDKVDSEYLSQITVDDFFSFIQYKNKNPSKNTKNESLSYITIINNYRHIKGFLDSLKANGRISHHCFIHSEKEIIKVLEVKNSTENKNTLDNTKYQAILEHLLKGQNHYRNIAIFLLCSYYGLKRSIISKLTWDSINFGKKTITIESRTYKMTKLIHYCLQSLNNEKTKQRLKCDAVFINSHIKGGKRVCENTINDIFYGLRKIDKDLKWLCPIRVRECLIQNMFECGYSIEQIIFYTGLEPSSITKYIPLEKIVALGKERFIKCNTHPVHPFQDVVNNFFDKNIGNNQPKNIQSNKRNSFKSYA